MHFNRDLVRTKHVATHNKVIHLSHTSHAYITPRCLLLHVFSESKMEVVIAPRSDTSCTSGAEGIKKGFSTHFTRNKNTSVSKSDPDSVIVVVM